MPTSFHSRWLGLFIVAAVCTLSAVAGAQGGPRAAGLSADGRPTDGSFFPLAVWLQAPRNARRYADLGINTYVALYRGPTAEQVDELEKAGLRLVSLQNQ